MPNDLDALSARVAELMGWKWAGASGAVTGSAYWYRPDGSGSCIPAYATNPAAADEVLKECNRRGWIVRIDLYPDGHGTHSVAIDDSEAEFDYGDNELAFECGDDWPEALCRAFVQAMESETTSEGAGE